MPIIKIYPSKRDVSAIINYVSREGTVAETLIETSGCSKDTAEQDFKAIAEYFDKPTGAGNRSYYHTIISYNTTLEKISPKKCGTWQPSCAGIPRLTIINGIWLSIRIVQIVYMLMS